MQRCAHKFIGDAELTVTKIDRGHLIEISHPPGSACRECTIDMLRVENARLEQQIIDLENALAIAQRSPADAFAAAMERHDAGSRGNEPSPVDEARRERLTFGRQLRDERTRAGITMGALARHLGIGVILMSEIELDRVHVFGGQTRFTNEDLARACKFMGSTPEVHMKLLAAAARAW